MGAIAKRTGTTRTVNETVIPSIPTVISPSATELGEEVRTMIETARSRTTAG